MRILTTAVLHAAAAKPRECGLAVVPIPFGWLNTLEIKAEGRPLSRVARIILGEWWLYVATRQRDSHAAFWSEQSVVALQTGTAEEVARVLSGQQPLYVVNPRMLGRARAAHPRREERA